MAITASADRAISVKVGIIEKSEQAPRLTIEI
jgi:hypothetical protein